MRGTGTARLSSVTVRATSGAILALPTRLFGPLRFLVMLVFRPRLEPGSTHGTASTIVDLTGERPRMLREGAVTEKELFELLPDLEPLA